jgi:hypothetical protein
MIRAHLFPLTTLVLIVSVPLAWLACGGGSKPPESPASETSSGASSSEPAGSETPAPSASASASSAAAETPAATTPTSESTAASTPPSPSFGNTDCGKCIDKTCSKQATACGKDTDCQATIDTIHNCSSGGAACVDSASAPSAPKAKKLAAAYEACGKKAAAKGGACKAKCQ